MATRRMVEKDMMFKIRIANTCVDVVDVPQWYWYRLWCSLNSTSRPTSIICQYFLLCAFSDFRISCVPRHFSHHWIKSTPWNFLGIARTELDIVVLICYLVKENVFRSDNKFQVEAFPPCLKIFYWIPWKIAQEVEIGSEYMRNKTHNTLNRVDVWSDAITLWNYS